MDVIACRAKIRRVFPINHNGLVATLKEVSAQTLTHIVIIVVISRLTAGFGR